MTENEQFAKPYTNMDGQLPGIPNGERHAKKLKPASRPIDNREPPMEQTPVIPAPITKKKLKEEPEQNYEDEYFKVQIEVGFNKWTNLENGTVEFGRMAMSKQGEALLGLIYCATADQIGMLAAKAGVKAMFENFSRQMRQVADPAAGMAQALGLTDNALFEQRQLRTDEKNRQLHLTAIYINEENLVLANAGDSKAYLIHEGKMQKLEVLGNTKAIGGKRELTASYLRIKLVKGDAIVVCSKDLSDTIGKTDLGELVKPEDTATVSAENINAHFSPKAKKRSDYGVIVFKAS